VHPHAAESDIGSDESGACVPEDRAAEPVRSFGAFTPDRYALAEWLAACRSETVAVESTGGYWLPAYELLEARGGRVSLVNACHRKHVPGRTSAVKDCQWSRSLPTRGLLSGSFRPAAAMCAVRAYPRHRAALLEYRAAHLQHMQQALQQMNVQLTQVLTDSPGAPGLAMIRAMVAGERDPAHLARFLAPRWASSTAEIAQALTGYDQPEHRFALQQALALYDVYSAQVRECDAEVEGRFQAIKPAWPDALPPLHRANKHRTHNQNAPDDGARGVLDQLTGVDLVAMPGLNASTAQTIPSEIGLDPWEWPDAKAFCSWLGLAPRQAISGGKVLRRGTLKTRNRAGQAVRFAAQAVSRSHHGLRAYYRRMRARQGPQAASAATAHQVARIVYHLLTPRTPFRDRSAEDDEQRARERDLAHWRQRAAKLGLTLVEAPA
jgi:transposase